MLEHWKQQLQHDNPSGEAGQESHGLFEVINSCYIHRTEGIVATKNTGIEHSLERCQGCAWLALMLLQMHHWLNLAELETRLMPRRSIGEVPNQAVLKCILVKYREPR